MAVGRFAPSPTGALHLGNLRTALVAWLCARSAGSGFLLRFEDLDRVTSSDAHRASQAADLHALGIDWDGEPLVQSTRFDAHHEALAALAAGGHTYECFCTRREIAEASQAPNGPAGPRYPGTCRSLSDRQRAEHLAAGRRPALRLRGHDQMLLVNDRFVGPSEHFVDDVVLRRNDGVPAYNLAVVVDDAMQGVEEVVRADDLLPSAAPQMAIASLLDIDCVSYVHVPLALGPSGKRLAKRDGAVTLADLAAVGRGPVDVLRQLAASLGFGDADRVTTAADLVDSFDLSRIPHEPWTVPL